MNLNNNTTFEKIRKLKQILKLAYGINFDALDEEIREEIVHCVKSTIL